MDREVVLLDAIARMRALKLSDADIEARLLKEVPGLSPAQVRVLFERSRAASTSAAEEPMADIQPDELWIEPEAGAEEPLPVQSSSSTRSPAPAPVERPAPAPPVAGVSSPAATQELWQNAILATVNQKLDEMVRIRTGLDALIDQKIESSNAREMTKFRVLLESQRSLLLSRVDGVLDSKSKDLVELINARVKDLSSSNAEITTAIAAFRQERDTQRQFAADFKKELAVLAETRQSMLSELRRELDALKTANESSSASARSRLDEYSVQINRLLELQSKASEGLVAEASKKIQDYSDHRYEELDAKINAQIGALSAEVRSSVAALEARFESESKRVARALNDLEEFYKLARTDLDPEKYRDRMLELEEQRKAVLVSTQQRLDDLGERIDAYARESTALSSALQSRLDTIDAKMKEWKSFETEFTQAMGLALDEFKKQSAAAKRRA